MGYGARGKRVPAVGNSAGVNQVDAFKMGIVGTFERGFKQVVQSGIYSFADFGIQMGLYGDGVFNSPYVVESFYKELEVSNPVEIKALGFVAADAVNATGVVNDVASSPAVLWNMKAAKKGVLDVSAFGNKIGIQLSTSELTTIKLTSAVAIGATSAVLAAVHNLKVNQYIRLAESGSDDEVVVITAIDPATKTITFAATTYGYTVALCDVKRVDIKVLVGVKNLIGEFELKETFESTLTKSDTAGILGIINSELDGSNYIMINRNAANASTAEEQIPADITAWQPLTSGADGTPATDADYLALMPYFTDTDITILIAPESATVEHNQNMAEWATADYKCMYYAQAANKAGEDSLKAFGDSMRKNVIFSMLPSDKWLGVTDAVTGEEKAIPKVGVDAAFWFNVYATVGESKVAAGNKPSMTLKSSDRLIDDNGLVHNDIAGKGGRLIREYGINICRSRPGIGINNNSARTFCLDKGYTFQNQIFAWIIYRKSVVAYLETIEQNRAGNMSQYLHRRAVKNFMLKKYEQGHLFKGKTDSGKVTGFNDVCIIVNDFSNNTLADIANGIEQTFLQFVAPPPIEEPILSLASAAVTTIKG